MKRGHKNCIIGDELSTGYTQVEGDPLDVALDLMDVPDLFSGEMTTTRSRGGRSGPTPYREGPRLKDDTVELPQDPRMFDAIRVAVARKDIVTSGKEGYPGDGVHDPASQHYASLAIDLRWSRDRRAQVQAYERAGYVVVSETDHLHVQRYPRKA